jgi:hypothetical protein
MRKAEETVPGASGSSPYGVTELGPCAVLYMAHGEGRVSEAAGSGGGGDLDLVALIVEAEHRAQGRPAAEGGRGRQRRPRARPTGTCVVSASPAAMAWKPMKSPRKKSGMKSQPRSSALHRSPPEPT